MNIYVRRIFVRDKAMENTNLPPKKTVCSKGVGGTLILPKVIANFIVR